MNKKRIELQPIRKKKVSKPKKRLYVWEHVLNDYTSGMIVVLADGIEEARKYAVEKINDPDVTVQYLKENPPCAYFLDRPDPICHYVYGGG